MRALAVPAVLVAATGCAQLLGLSAPTGVAVDAATPQGWTSVAGGFEHTCAIRTDQSLWCWGRNDYGQLGVNNTLPELDQPAQVAGSWISVATRVYHTCAIDTSNALWCWGINFHGQLAEDPAANAQEVAPVRVGSGQWIAVAAGETFTCAIAADGSLWCWGDDELGELGTGPGSGSSTPRELGAGPWHGLVAGYQFACALDANGAASCWGNNGNGECGTITSANPAPIAPISGSNTFVQLTAGAYFACGVRDDGKLRCWGADSLGELGDDGDTDESEPVAVDYDQITDWTTLAAGFYHACALRSDGSLWCWGNDAYEEFATTTAASFQGTPVPVGSASYLELGLGAYHTCAIDGTHQLECAGLGGGGQLATLGSHLSPTQIAGTWTAASAGRLTTCGLTFLGSGLSCWGYNGTGAVGDGTTADRQQPTTVAGSWTSTISVGDHACSLDSSHALWCWGANYLMQLDDTTTVDRTAPEQVSGGSFMMVSAKYQHTCAITSGNLLLCWGSNQRGESGASPSTSVPAAVTVTGAWTAVANGFAHTCAVNQSGGVRCFGDGLIGELGDGMNTSSYTPVAVTGLSGAIDQITAGEYHTCVRQGVAVTCWGYDSHGQLGNMSTSVSPTPVALPGSWSDISAGDLHTCGVQSDGSLWCWGSNERGELGIGSLIEHHEPMKVGSDTDWLAVQGGEEYTCALKHDGTLWCWGSNNRGQIGDGTAWSSTLTLVR
ncbi:MAG: hypothetical protein JOY80_07430 [Candidatus Dormibacteraeota bacterium]|nr:hypothetical protein [Candidatus Dormibacteraeota bacterium]